MYPRDWFGVADQRIKIPVRLFKTVFQIERPAIYIRGNGAGIHEPSIRIIRGLSSDTVCFSSFPRTTTMGMAADSISLLHFPPSPLSRSSRKFPTPAPGEARKFAGMMSTCCTLEAATCFSHYPLLTSGRN